MDRGHGRAGLSLPKQPITHQGLNKIIYVRCINPTVVFCTCLLFSFRKYNIFIYHTVLYTSYHLHMLHLIWSLADFRPPNLYPIAFTNDERVLYGSTNKITW